MTTYGFSPFFLRPAALRSVGMGFQIERGTSKVNALDSKGQIGPLGAGVSGGATFYWKTCRSRVDGAKGPPFVREASKGGDLDPCGVDLPPWGMGSSRWGKCFRRPTAPSSIGPDQILSVGAKLLAPLYGFRGPVWG